MQRRLVETVGVGAIPMLTEALAVIRREHHEGTREAAVRLERPQQAPQLGIRVGDLRIIGAVDEALRPGGWRAPVLMRVVLVHP